MKVRCRHFFSVPDTASLQRLMQDPDFHAIRRQFPDFLVLGAGSNMLFTADIDGVVLQVAMEEMEVLRETSDEVFFRAGAGIAWHTLVSMAIRQNWGGIENLSCIPGSVGAAPVQNIGAYGVEVSSVIEAVQAYDMWTDQLVTIGHADCAFGYRESFFKKEGKGRYIITAVDFRFCKQPRLQLDYGSIREELARQQITQPTIADISNVVCAIRASKLPSPADIGNAGSFFKNPVIGAELFHAMQHSYPAMPYHISGGSYKVPAGWLIEQAGWKGYREGDAGCHAKQALVLVNYGNASGQELLALSNKIQASVQAQFGIVLEREVLVFPPEVGQ